MLVPHNQVQTKNQLVRLRLEVEQLVLVGDDVDGLRDFDFLLRRLELVPVAFVGDDLEGFHRLNPSQHSVDILRRDYFTVDRFDEVADGQISLKN